MAASVVLFGTILLKLSVSILPAAEYLDAASQIPTSVLYSAVYASLV